MANLPDRIQSALFSLVERLAKGEFKEIEGDGTAGRMSASEIEQAVKDYGRTLVVPPRQLWEEVVSTSLVVILGEWRSISLCGPRKRGEAT